MTALCIPRKNLWPNSERLLYCTEIHGSDPAAWLRLKKARKPLMPEGYGTHRDYIDRVQADVNARLANVEAALRAAFAGFIERREVEVVLFSSMDVFTLAR